MADYNSDRTGSNIDLTLDKVDALDAKVQPIATGANVTGTLVSDGLTVENATNSALTLKSTKTGTWTSGEVLGRIDFYGSDTSGSGATNKISLSAESTNTFGAAFDLEIKTDNGLLGPTKTATFANNGDVSFYEDTGTTAKMVWSSSAESLTLPDLKVSGGVYLGGTGAANKLDDYEEGNFTAAITTGGGSVTLSASNLRYVKIGSSVTVGGRLTVGSVSSPTGFIEITLPFRADLYSSNTGFNVGMVNSASKTYNDFTGLVFNETSTFRVYLADSNTISSSAANAQQLQATTVIDLSFTYMTNS